MKTRASAEQAGVKFAETAFGTSSLEALRAKSAQEILDAALKVPRENFTPIVDGYFLPDDCSTLYAQGRQSHVPLLAGWNKDESDYASYFTNDPPTLENYLIRARSWFGTNAEAFLKAYPAATDAEAKAAAGEFARDRFIVYATWKWLESHLQTGGSPVYRYRFDQNLPLAPDAPPETKPAAHHASEIEFVFQVLSSKPLPWRAEHRKTSELMASYWSNFAKTGDPNGPGLPHWPKYGVQGAYAVMHLDGDHPGAAPDPRRAHYELVDELRAAGVFRRPE